MDEDDDIECAGECNYIVRRETGTGPDGAVIVEEVERCTGCGRIISRAAVIDTEPPNLGISGLERL
jgi:hypothetical protein